MNSVVATPEPSRPRSCDRWKYINPWICAWFFCITNESEFERGSWRGVLDTTQCDKVCEWLMTGWWIPLGTLAFNSSCLYIFWKKYIHIYCYWCYCIFNLPSHFHFNSGIFNDIYFFKLLSICMYCKWHYYVRNCTCCWTAPMVQCYNTLAYTPGSCDSKQVKSTKGFLQ